jgi:hypothetical protein
VPPRRVCSPRPLKPFTSTTAVVALPSQANDGEGEREGHVAHGAPPGFDPRCAQEGEPVADRLDPGVPTGTHAVGTQQHQQHPQQADLVVGGVDVSRRHPPTMGADLGLWPLIWPLQSGLRTDPEPVQGCSRKASPAGSRSLPLPARVPFLGGRGAP